MTIRKKKDKLDNKICKATDKIIRLQLKCPHENTTLKNYSYRVGCVSEAYICDDCDQFIAFKEPYIINGVSTSTSTTITNDKD